MDSLTWFLKKKAFFVCNLYKIWQLDHDFEV